ncbi:MAG: molybdopterin-dependent oxidoreductase [Pyrinomonadaceae bacterium]
MNEDKRNEPVSPHDALAHSSTDNDDATITSARTGDGELIDPSPINSSSAIDSPSIVVSEDEGVEREIRRRTRRSFLVAALAVLGGFGGWRWLRGRREDEGLAWPLRRAHEINEQLARDYFSDQRLAPTFPNAKVQARLNGDIGMDDPSDLQDWSLTVIGLADEPAWPSNAAKRPNDAKPSAPNAKADAKSSAPNAKSNPGDAKKSAAKNDNNSDEDDSSSDEGDETADDSADNSDNNASDDSGDAAADDEMTDAITADFTLDDIKRLPRVEMVTELKCIEGWSVMVRWAGARFADFIAKYPPDTRSGNEPDVFKKPEDLVEYVSLETPDGGYYVGLEMASALHPQTLLCYEMNGQPLTPEHGAPLRLAIPVKYGIKNIKRIGTIRYTNKRPADYWAERGYDWYSGH